MIMPAAVRVKRSIAIWAMIAGVHVVPDCCFFLANATVNGRLIPFYFFPLLRCVPGRLFMAFITGIVSIAAFEFNSDYIQG
jgi:hypothetical protein